MIGFLLRVVIGLVLMLTFSVCVQAAEVGHELGRVFLSPAERATLDKERAEHYSPTISEPVEPIIVVEEPESGEFMEVAQKPKPSLLVNGYVKRARTSGTVWVNGQSSYDGDLAVSEIDHLHTKIIGRSVKLAPLDDGEAIYLKPGQVFVPDENSVSDSYSDLSSSGPHGAAP